MGNKFQEDIDFKELLRDSFLIDTHAHLNMSGFEDLSEVLDRAGESGIRYIINVGASLESSKTAVELACAHEMLYAAIGIHPHDSKDADSNSLKTLENLAKTSKVVAIGETGLDFYYQHSPIETQKEIFIKHLELADKLNLSVIVHSRQAERETIEILKKYPVKSGGVIHCFSGDEKMLNECLEMGFYIGITGTVTFSKAADLGEIVKKIPNDRLLIETDCPYLTPVPWRGKRNEPSYLRSTAHKIAQLKNLSVSDIARITSLNAHNLFNIDGINLAGKIAYPIRDSLYLNITNRCTNRCDFCARNETFFVQGHNLCLDHEPDFNEIINSLPDLAPYKEIVFCGLGEPLMRLDITLAVARYMKEKGKRIRVNTNGQGNLIYKRNIIPELAGLIDAISVSMNAPGSQQYQKICQSEYGESAYVSILEFIRLAVGAGIEVTATVLDLPEINLDACASVAKQLAGVPLRIRHYNQVG